MNFIRSVFHSFVGQRPQPQHPPPTEPSLPDFDYNPRFPSPIEIDETEFNLPPPMPSRKPAPRPKQCPTKARAQPPAHRRQTRPAPPDEPIDDPAVGRPLAPREDAEDATHPTILNAGQPWHVARGE